jgi:hypothetical protein
MNLSRTCRFRDRRCTEPQRPWLPFARQSARGHSRPKPVLRKQRVPGKSEVRFLALINCGNSCQDATTPSSDLLVTFLQGKCLGVSTKGTSRESELPGRLVRQLQSVRTGGEPLAHSLIFTEGDMGTGIFLETPL